RAGRSGEQRRACLDVHAVPSLGTPPHVERAQRPRRDAILPHTTHHERVTRDAWRASAAERTALIIDATAHAADVAAHQPQQGVHVGAAWVPVHEPELREAVLRPADAPHAVGLLEPRLEVGTSARVRVLLLPEVRPARVDAAALERFRSAVVLSVAASEHAAHLPLVAVPDGCRDAVVAHHRSPHPSSARRASTASRLSTSARTASSGASSPHARSSSRISAASSSSAPTSAGARTTPPAMRGGSPGTRTRRARSSRLPRPTRRWGASVRPWRGSRTPDTAAPRQPA